MPVTAQQREHAAHELQRNHACGRLAGASLEPRLARVRQAASESELAQAFQGLPAPEFLQNVDPMYPTWSALLLV